MLYRDGRKGEGGRGDARRAHFFSPTWSAISVRAPLRCCCSQAFVIFFFFSVGFRGRGGKATAMRVVWGVDAWDGGGGEGGEER